MTRRIGDVEPFHDIDHHALHVARCRRGALRTAAKNNSSTLGTNTARKLIAEAAERERIRTDPVEQAKTALRRRGYKVYSCAIYGGPKSLYIVGTKAQRFTASELIEMAGRLAA